MHFEKDVRIPNGKTRVQPATVFFPAACGHRIDTQENICLTQFDGLVTIDQCIGRGTLRKVHGDRVHFAFRRVPQGNRADYIRDELTVSVESSPEQTNKRDRPTVNKNGHREKVNVGVCNLGSSTEMNGCKKDSPTCQRLFNAQHVYAYVYPRIKASHRRVGSCPCCDKIQQTHMSNNFSTSSGVTSLCTKISGGLVLSIKDLRKPRFVDGPGIKNVLLATPYQQRKGFISPLLPCGRTCTQTRI